MKITKEELAAQLNSNEYGSEVSEEQRILAKDNDLVIVYGASDDLMEFRGAIYDELGAYGGVTAYLTKDGLITIHGEDPDDCKHCYLYEKEIKKAATIEAVWRDDDSGAIPWTFKTSIPHVTFDTIIDDGNIWSRGIVFSMGDFGW